MDIALLALKLMLGFSVLILLIAGGALAYYDHLGAFAGSIIGLLVQSLFLAVLFVFLKRGSRIAGLLFGFWCIWLLLSGITSEPEWLAVIDYALAVLGFVGLAGLWKAHHERRSALLAENSEAQIDSKRTDLIPTSIESGKIT